MVPHGGNAAGVGNGVAGLQPPGHVVLVVVDSAERLVVGDGQRAVRVILVPQDVIGGILLFHHQPELPVFVVAVMQRVPVAVGRKLQLPAVRPVGVADELAAAGPVYQPHRLLVPQRVVGEEVLEPVMGDGGKAAPAVVAVGVGGVPAAHPRQPVRAVIGVAGHVPLRVGHAVHQTAHPVHVKGGGLPALVIGFGHIMPQRVVFLACLQIGVGGVQRAAGGHRPHPCLGHVAACAVIAKTESKPGLVRPRCHQPVLVRGVVGIAVAFAQRFVGYTD